MTSTTTNSDADWFSNNIPTWTELVIPYLKQLTARRKSLKALEIGSFEGRSAGWLLANAPMIKHMWCIDDWKPRGSYRRFSERVLKKFDHVTPLRGDFREILRSKPLSELPRVDFVYVDTTFGSGQAKDFLEAAVLTFPMLNPGGMIVFDDYTNSKEHDFSCPRHGIDVFLDLYHAHVKVVHLGWQAVVIKRRQPLPEAETPCHSEYYHEKLEDV